MEGVINEPIFVYVYIFLPLVGIGLIVFALVRERRLTRRPVEIALDRLGMGLKADAFGLMILAGLVMVCVGVFFLYRGYQTRLEEKDTVAGFVATVEKKVREYNLDLILDLPKDLNPNRTMADLYVRKKGTYDDVLYRHLKKLERGPGGFVVRYSGLSEGDTVYVFVEAEYVGKKWQSNYISVPTAYLKMNPIDNTGG